jgi:hypothetical protein
MELVTCRFVRGASETLSGRRPWRLIIHVDLR